MSPEPHDPTPSSVFQRFAPPRVTQPSSPWTVVLGAAGVVVLGLIVFGSLNAGRQARAQQPARPVRIALATPSPAVRLPPVVLTVSPPIPQRVAAAPVVVSDLADPRWHTPAMIVDLTDAGRPAGTLVVAAPASAGGPALADDKLSAEERFSNRVTSSQVDTARATRLRDLTRIAPQGTIIPAVLETAINSDLPGSVRAVVSRDVRGFDGTQVLIPRGSKLIGQYRSAAAIGQTRAFVVWSRILTPAGVSIDVGSPATDRLGRGGLDGETDTHFFRRFGASILLSVMSAGLEAASRGSGTNNTALIIGSPQEASRVAEIALQKEIDIPDTIKVPQGAPLQVFVARDLDFTGVPAPAP